MDKHKVLQILLNLINNAIHACCEQHTDTEPESPKRTIFLHIFSSGKNRISFQVSDNGVGISKENLIKIFQHGFTTRKTGHGFGLHSGALAAKELDGRLNAQSEGIGCGATFVLELPCNTKTGSKKSVV
ncbi:ATP-binding protein [Desulfobacter curvatus]|uniref:ATP-binding protein n=1 Tax=Desulfobacter curvatus TaxID=2290 RepID=UPI00036CBC09|nr:ATP-binding protein [Desulfobacter curvatus]